VAGEEEYYRHMIRHQCGARPCHERAQLEAQGLDFRNTSSPTRAKSPGKIHRPPRPRDVTPEEDAYFRHMHRHPKCGLGERCREGERLRVAVYGR